jgi:hypothetical protein
LGSGISLREAVVLSVYMQLIHDPSPALFGHVLDRCDGKLPTEGTLNLGLASPEWIALKVKIADALAPFPVALGALRQALEET